MNRTVRDATTKVFQYQTTQALCAHVLAFVAAYNFAKHLKALRCEHRSRPSATPGEPTPQRSKSTRTISLRDYTPSVPAATDDEGEEALDRQAASAPFSSLSLCADPRTRNNLVENVCRPGRATSRPRTSIWPHFEAYRRWPSLAASRCRNVGNLPGVRGFCACAAMLGTVAVPTAGSDVMPLCHR